MTLSLTEIAKLESKAESLFNSALKENISISAVKNQVNKALSILDIIVRDASGKSHHFHALRQAEMMSQAIEWSLIGRKDNRSYINWQWDKSFISSTNLLSDEEIKKLIEKGNEYENKRIFSKALCFFDILVKYFSF